MSHTCLTMDSFGWSLHWMDLDELTDTSDVGRVYEVNISYP